MAETSVRESTAVERKTRSRALGGDRLALLLQVGTIALLIIAWEVVGRVMPDVALFFPPLTEIASRGFELFASGEMNQAMTVTAIEVLWGFLIGSGLGVVAGVLLGSNRFLNAVLAPYVLYTASIPKIILYPIFILIVGIGIWSKVAVGAASAFFPVAINTMAGIALVPPVLIKAAQTLGARKHQLYLHVYLPHALGPIVAGLRVGLGVAIVGTLLAETKVARDGLGQSAIDFYAEFQFPAMYAVIIFIFVVVLGLNWGLGWLHRRATRYRGEGTQTTGF